MAKKTLVQPGCDCINNREVQAGEFRIYSRHPMKFGDMFDLIEGLLAPFKDIHLAMGTVGGNPDYTPFDDESARRYFALVDQEATTGNKRGLVIDITGWEEQ